MKILNGIGLTALALTALGAAGTADFEDAKASEAEYCDRVLAGAHSDYLELGGVCHDSD